MIVIAIIGILSAVAVPQYTKYTKRAKFTELLALISKYKIASEIAYQVAEIPVASLTSGSNGIPPEMNATNSVSEQLLSAGVTSGKITIAAKSTLDDATYVLQAATSQNGKGLSWTMDESASTCIQLGLCIPPQ